MRKILFRGKRKDNGEWVEGFYLSIGKRAYIICEAETECVDGENTDLYATEWYEVDPETVCQYAYATAIDGKKIFEHDIVKDDGSAIGVVRFGKYGNGPHIGFYIQWVNCDFRQELGFWDGKVKVIGNIFDNPELLKGDAK